MRCRVGVSNGFRVQQIWGSRDANNLPVTRRGLFDAEWVKCLVFNIQGSGFTVQGWGRPGCLSVTKCGLMNRRLVSEAHRLVYHSTLGSRVIKRRKRETSPLLMPNDSNSCSPTRFLPPATLDSRRALDAVCPPLDSSPPWLCPNESISIYLYIYIDPFIYLSIYPSISNHLYLSIYLSI